MGENLLQMKGIVKRFPGTVALKGVDLDVQEGEIHGLLGENGAGKSTLIKALTGAYAPDEGEIIIRGKSYSQISVRDLDELGIAAVYQDLKLAPLVSVMENILMGSLPKRAGGFVDYSTARQQAREALQRAGAENVDPTGLVGDLKVADQELVAIAKALNKDANLLILDEPTALLGEDDVERLFDILRELGGEAGEVAILYISHKLEEIFSLCQRATVLRDGEKIWTKEVKDVSEEELIEAISGQAQAEEDVYRETSVEEEPLLKVEGLTNSPDYEEVSFELKGGEVLGIYGLVGAGKSELLNGIFGGMPADSGKVFLGGDWYRPASPQKSAKKGLGFVPEDRASEGLLERLPVYLNVNLASYSRFSAAGWVTPAKDRERAESLAEEFNVKYSSVDQTIEELSGGNQQKVLLAKALGNDIKVLLLGEPTSGIDVGARREIFHLTRQLAEEGKAVIYASSYLPEIMEVADRILVMARGRISAEFSREEGFDDLEINKAAYAAE